MRCGRVYCGGSARLVEKLFNSKEDELLYVGDHLFTDANAVKASMRWRTALVVQELDLEIRAAATETRRTAQIDALLGERDNLESELNVKRLALERWDQDRQPSPGLSDEAHAEEYRRDVVSLRAAVKQVDDRLEPLLARVGEAFNRHWGYLTRAGHDDKSHIARQIEKYAGRLLREGDEPRRVHAVPPLPGRARGPGAHHGGCFLPPLHLTHVCLLIHPFFANSLVQRSPVQSTQPQS